MNKAIFWSLLLAVWVSPAVAQLPWQAWSVHGGRIVVDSTGPITAEVSSDGRFHWNKDDWSDQIGQKAYVSTNQFNGMTIAALTSITYDVAYGNWADVNFNIIVQDGSGKRAVVAPGDNSAVSSGFEVGAVAKIYHILEAEPGWTGTALVGPNAANWAEIAALVIAEGPAPDAPDTLWGQATSQNDLVYDASNWDAWATKSGFPGAEQGGLLIAFGQSKGLGWNDREIRINNLQVNYTDVGVNSKPEGSTYDARAVGVDEAVMRGGIVADGNDDCWARFRYWSETGPKQYTDWDCCYSSSGFSIPEAHVQNLTPGTTYTFSLELQNSYGWWVLDYDTRTFETKSRLTISSGPGGIVSEPGEGLFTYDYDMLVSITALATGADPFVQWSGSAVDAGLVDDPFAASTTVLAQGDHTLIANFQAVGPGPGPGPGDLVAHYIFAGNAMDITGNGNNGTLVNNPSFVLDVNGPGFGSAVSLNGVDSTVMFPRSIEEDWTMTLWFRTEDPNRDGFGGPEYFGNGFGLLSGKTAGWSDDFGVSFQSRAVSYGVGRPWDAGTTLVAPEAITDTEWHHIVATRNANSGDMALYVDGALAVNDIGPVGPKTSSPFLLAGAINFEPGKFLWGDLADVRLYDYVLDTNEIAGLAFRLEVRPMDQLFAVGSPLTAVLFDGHYVGNLVLGTTTFAGPPLYPLFPPSNADNLNLDAPASADSQPFMKTMFLQPVTQIYVLERGADDSGFFQALNSLGEPVGGMVPFGPTDFLNTGYLFLGQTGGGLVVNSQTPIYGLAVYPPNGGPLQMDPVCIVGNPAN